MLRPIRFRAYIGPRPVPSNAATSFGKWDWFTAIGSAYALPPYIGKRTLTLGISGITTGPLVFTGGALPATGGVWVGPKGVGETWEYMPYHGNGATEIENVERNVPPGNAGTHGGGADMYFWYPLDTNDGSLSFQYEASDNMASRNWTAKLSGVQAPAMILKPEHMIIVTYVEGEITELDQADADFKLLFLGFVERVNMAQNAGRFGKWDIDIVSTARLLQNSTIPGVRMGPLNIALQADAEVSSSLGAAWKLTLPQRIQAAAGAIPEIDIVEFQSDLGPEHIVDDNPNTLWVSDGWRGPGQTNTLGHNSWNALFTSPPPTDPMGVRYLEIINHPGLDITWMWVYHKYSYKDEFGATQWKGRWIQASEPNLFQDFGIDNGTFDEVDDTVVIAENGEVFSRVYPSANPKALLDAATFTGPQDVEAVRRLWWEAGAIFMAWSSPENSAGYLISWGNVTRNEINSAWDDHGTPDFSLPATTFHLSETILTGEVTRRDLSNAGIVYTADYLHHPGYVINTSDDVEYVKIVLPEMTHVLRDDIAFGATTVYLIDAQGNPNVEGLSVHGSGGAVFIDDEIITFTGKDYYTGALTGCTVGQAHKAKSRVYPRWEVGAWGRSNTGVGNAAFYTPLQDKVLDIAVDAYPLEKLEWGRGFYGNGNPRYPYIGSYTVRFSPNPEARGAIPSEQYFREDYLPSPVIDSNSWSPSVNVPNASVDTTVAAFGANGFRPRTILMQIREMRDASNANVVERPRLNYFKAFVDRRYFNPDTWFDTTAGTGWANELLISSFLKLSGWYNGLFSTLSASGDPVQIARQSGITEPDTAWRVAVDAAEYGNSVIWVRRNSRVQITQNVYLGKASHAPDRTFTTEDIAELEIVNIRPAEVGQVRLTWESGDGKRSGVALWPDVLPRGTSLVEIGPVIANDQATADSFAFNHYRTKRFPYNVFVRLAHDPADVAEIPLNIEVGEIHQIDYDFLLDGQITRKMLLVESVAHEIQGGYYQTIVGYREIDRETV